MSLFARALKRTTLNGDNTVMVLALVAFSRGRKAGPTGFALYRFVDMRDWRSERRYEIFPLETATSDEEDAVRRFWPWLERESGNEFPGLTNENWRRTSPWLRQLLAGDAFGKDTPSPLRRVGRAKHKEPRRNPREFKPTAGNLSPLFELEAKQAQYVAELMALQKPSVSNRSRETWLSQQIVLLDLEIRACKKKMGALAESKEEPAEAFGAEESVFSVG
ncbi:MAG: hypothetical protein G01um101449_554 [Parcubacteria group bacterium Gr01-1014_49]|nr:MAG: hypothetical protein G01um101449_554 [Parcubacteria group bacterium Gr01-1014_49]